MFVYIVLIFVQLLFSLNFLATKVLMHSLSTFDWAFLRFVGASVGMGAIAVVFYRAQWQRLTPMYFVKLAALSLLGIVFTQVTFIKGISLSTATDVSILATMIPLFTLLVVVIRGEEKLTMSKSIGFVLSFSGVLILQRIENFSFSNETVVGNFYILLSTFSVGLFFSYSKSFFKQNDPILATALMFVFSTIFIFPFSLYDGNQTTHLMFKGDLWQYGLYSVLGGTVLTYFLGNWALSRIDAAKVSLFVYLQPVFSSALAFVFLGEHFTWRVFFAMVLIFSGFLFALEKRDKRKD